MCRLLFHYTRILGCHHACVPTLPGARNSPFDIYFHRDLHRTFWLIFESSSRVLLGVNQKVRMQTKSHTGRSGMKRACKKKSVCQQKIRLARVPANWMLGSVVGSVGGSAAVAAGRGFGCGCGCGCEHAGDSATGWRQAAADGSVNAIGRWLALPGQARAGPGPGFREEGERQLGETSDASRTDRTGGGGERRRRPRWGGAISLPFCLLFARVVCTLGPIAHT
jgi:hypothetical protein